MKIMKKQKFCVFHIFSGRAKHWNSLTKQRGFGGVGRQGLPFHLKVLIFSYFHEKDEKVHISTKKLILGGKCRQSQESMKNIAAGNGFHPPRGGHFPPKKWKNAFSCFFCFSHIVHEKGRKSEENDQKWQTFGVWAENDLPEPLKKHCPSKVFGRAGRRCAHFMKIGEIPGNSPKYALFHQKPRFSPIFSFFHVFAILRFRSISVPPTPPKINTFYSFSGGAEIMKWPRNHYSCL